jgi:hypothetical protein
MGSIQSTARQAVGVLVSSCTDVGEHAPSDRRPPPDQVGRRLCRCGGCLFEAIGASLIAQLQHRNQVSLT